jgi:hypothetical protein
MLLQVPLFLQGFSISHRVPEKLQLMPMFVEFMQVDGTKKGDGGLATNKKKR